jgi:hypothetical protein
MQPRVILCILAGVLPLFAAGDTATAVSVKAPEVKIPDETAPPGGMVQMKLMVTEPTPIISGKIFFPFDAAVFDGVSGINLLNPTGDVNGVAIIQGNRVAIRYSSTTGTTGTDYPIMTIALPIRSGAAPGQKTQFALDPTSAWLLDLLGVVSPTPIPPATVTVGGTVSITNVTPGGGVLNPGAIFTIHGVGFQPQTRVGLNEIKASSIEVLSPQEIRVTVAETVQLTGQKIQVLNPDGSQDVYFSYMRGNPLGTSAQPLLAAALPIFSAQSFSQATFGPMVSGVPGLFYGLAMQNQNLDPVDITVEMHSLSGTLLGSSTFTLPAGRSIARELSEWAPFPAPGGFVRVTASAPVQMFGLLGDTNLDTMVPFRPLSVIP